MSSQVEPQEEIEDVTGVLAPEAGLPVPSPSGAAAAPPASPAVQAVAVAATGIVAGAATVAAVRRVRTHGLPSLRRSRKARPLQVLASRSFLVDIHLLDRG